MNDTIKNKIGWWGKFECFANGLRKPVKIWIGPMSKSDMLLEYSEFRHNFCESAPIVVKDKVKVNKAGVDNER